MATKKAAAKKTTKKTVKRTTAKKCATKKESAKCANSYFWGGIAIALCAAGAFIVLSLGVSKMIR